MTEPTETTLAERRPQDHAMAPVQELSPMGMISSIVQQGADPEALERVTAWAERMQANEARRAFAQAMTNFKAICPTVNRDRKGHTNTYATLVGIDETIRPALTQCQLSPSWRVLKNDKDWIEVECRVTHVMGHYEATSFGGPPDIGPGRNVLQARASTVSYLERYTLKALLGIVDKDMPDNDGGDGAQTQTKSPASQAMMNADEDEKKARADFRKVAEAKAKAQMTNAALKTLLSAVQQASGQDSTADCVKYLDHDNVLVGTDGSLGFINDAAFETDSSSPSDAADVPQDGQADTAQPVTDDPPAAQRTMAAPEGPPTDGLLSARSSDSPEPPSFTCRKGHKLRRHQILPSTMVNSKRGELGFCPTCKAAGESVIVKEK